MQYRNTKFALGAAILAAALFPTAALASDCAHTRSIDLALDLNGVRTVAFDVGPHDLEVRGADDAGGRLHGRACASSEDALDGLRATQSRRGDTLQVRLEREGRRSWSLFGSEYPRLDVVATLPAGVAVRADIGSGDASVSGVASLVGEIGSGDLQVKQVPGRVEVSVGSGDARLEDIGALRVGSIGSGDVTAARVRGDVSVGGVGSGDFDVYGAAGDVDVESVGSGDIGARNIGGSLRVGSVGSGDVEASDVRGDLVVRALGSGGVDHRGVAGRVQLPVDD